MATPTRADIENDLVYGNRLFAAMDRVGLDISTSGANKDLNAPLRDALVAEGMFTADPLTVSDVDFATLSGPSLTRFRVVAHLRVVELIIDAWDMGMAGAPTDADKAFIAALQRRKAALQEEVRRPIRPADAPSIGQYNGHRCGGAVPRYPDFW